MQLRFQCGLTVVSPGAFRAVASRSMRGTLRVESFVPGPDGRGSASAYYSWRNTGSGRSEGTFYLRTDWNLAEMGKRALLVHEATHAIQDRLLLPMGRADAECAAYLAQTLYFRAHGERFTEHCRRRRRAGYVPPAHHAAGDRLLERLEAIADRLRSDAPGIARVTGDEHAGLRRAIAAHPVYRDEADQVVDFDGWNAGAP